MQVPNRHADGYVKFRQKHVNQKGDTIQAELSARRVADTDGEQVQISLAITTCYKQAGRHMMFSSALDLSEAEASALIAALSKPWTETNKQQEKIDVKI